MSATNSASWSGGITQYSILRLVMPFFFRVLRTVSAQIEGTTSNSTSSSASNCNDHRPYPAGGFPSRIAISFASPTPSSLHGVGAVARFLRSNAASKPAVTNRSRRFSTVRTEQSYASPIFTSGQLWPIRIRLEQNLGPLHFLRRPLEPLDDIPAHATFLDPTVGRYTS